MTDWTALSPTDLEAKVKDFTANNRDILFEVTARRGYVMFDRKGFTFRLPAQNFQKAVHPSRYHTYTEAQFGGALYQLYADNLPMFTELQRRHWYIFWDHQLHLAIPDANADFSDLERMLH